VSIFNIQKKHRIFLEEIIVIFLQALQEETQYRINKHTKMQEGEKNDFPMKQQHRRNEDHRAEMARSANLNMCCTRCSPQS
jgi:hypothetical protein